jgi:murein L,D-transpeptidase YafK
MLKNAWERRRANAFQSKVVPLPYQTGGKLNSWNENSEKGRLGQVRNLEPADPSGITLNSRYIHQNPMLS